MRFNPAKIASPETLCPAGIAGNGIVDLHRAPDAGVIGQTGAGGRADPAAGFGRGEAMVLVVLLPQRFAEGLGHEARPQLDDDPPRRGEIGSALGVEEPAASSAGNAEAKEKAEEKAKVKMKAKVKKSPSCSVTY